MSLPPIHDGPSTGKAKRGAKTVRHYADALKAQHDAVLEWQAKVEQYPCGSSSGDVLSWLADSLFEAHKKKFASLLRQAQRTHPGHHWGYPEG